MTISPFIAVKKITNDIVGVNTPTTLINKFEILTVDKLPNEIRQFTDTIQNEHWVRNGYVLTLKHNTKQTFEVVSRDLDEIFQVNQGVYIES